MYSEELDWCKRAKDAGWRVVFLAEAQIIHHGGKSSDQVVARRHILFQQSKLRYFRKYHGASAAQTLRAFLLLNYAVQLGLEAAKGLLGHKRALRQERVRQYWQVLRSGLKVILMRIGMITGEYPPMQGGVGAFTRILAGELAAQGHDLFVLSRDGTQSDDPRVAPERQHRQLGRRQPARRAALGARATASTW